MTTTEIIEAEQLARWIDGERDTLPSEECSVALWAMRPDLAPGPKVGVDDILSKVTSGPFFETDSVSIGFEGTEGDDFVDALFAQSRTTISRKVSLQDVLERVESGPFAVKGVEGTASVEEKRPVPLDIEDRTLAESANNNRWWTRPWVAGGLAIALVLFTLIPSQFETPVSQDSIFTYSFEVEEALPAEEIEAKNIAPTKQPTPSEVTSSSSGDFAEPEPEVASQMRSRSKPPLDSPKKKVKAQPVKELKSESRPFPRSQVQGEQEELSEGVETNALGKQFETLETVNDPADFETPVPETTTLNQLPTDAGNISDTNSSVSSREVLQNTANDLDGNAADIYTNENTGVMQDEFLDRVDFDSLDEENLTTPTALMMSISGKGAATASSDGEVDLEDDMQVLSIENMEENLEEGGGSHSSLDSVVEEVAKESFALPKRKKERSSAGLLSKRQQTPMEEEPMSLQSAESVTDSDGLPFILTQKQKRAVQQADSVQTLLALCDESRPTQSLDILWLASQRVSASNAITLLQYSSQYDHGDARYLKRNWLHLASLLRQTGQVEEASKYEQLASSLP